MPLYRVARKSDYAEVYRYASDAAVEWVGMEFAAATRQPGAYAAARGGEVVPMAALLTRWPTRPIS